MLELKYLDDAILRQKSAPVENFGEETKRLAEDMLESLAKFNGVGLAAVQVGLLYRMFVVDTHKDGERLVFVNPEIIGTSDDSVPYNEGCLSVPGQYADVYRPSEVEVAAQDVNGKRFTLKAGGLLARVIQHEYDHLDGMVFIDHLAPAEKNEMVHEFKLQKKKRKKR